ncbi:hypothetical protein Pve01_84330 [Planomonospora venezuelensis]|nr:hypothetical protein Pve01_84330 [Planomonospora venezuelensis]
MSGAVCCRFYQAGGATRSRVEVVVSSVEAKAKLSQNRSDEDRAGVAAGLAADGREPDGLVAP